MEYAAYLCSVECHDKFLPFSTVVAHVIGTHTAHTPPPRSTLPPAANATDGTHPTGMLSCLYPSFTQYGYATLLLLNLGN